MEGRGNEGRGGPCPEKLSTPQLKFLVAPLIGRLILSHDGSFPLALSAYNASIVISPIREVFRVHLERTIGRRKWLCASVHTGLLLGLRRMNPLKSTGDDALRLFIVCTGNTGRSYSTAHSLYTGLQ